MGSIQMTLLDYLRPRTQLDWDSLDLTGYDENGPWADATSNPWEVYTVINLPENAELLRSSIETAVAIESKFPEVTLEELAFDVCAANLAVRIAPKIMGNVHLMANPQHTFNIQRVVEHGKRYHALCQMLDPSFDTRSRLVMKIAATWEGLQAARQLKEIGIKTLATTLFSKEQVILAGEVGCVSISPFIHELKAVFDETYLEDGGPISDFVVQAQQYYERNNIPTKVKACANMQVNEIVQLAGLNAYTAAPTDLTALAATKYDPDTSPVSLFSAQSKSQSNIVFEGLSYINDEAKYRMDFAASGGGTAQYKLMQAMAIFCDFQHKGLTLIRNTRAGNNNRIVKPVA